MGAIDYLPHYTYEDYENWQGRWEVIDGVPYAMSPMPKGKHQRISNNIAFEVQSKLKNCKRCKVFMPVDWVVRNDTIIQPDNLIVCDVDVDFIKLTKTPALVVEILSPSTEKKDRGLKFEIYEREKVKYYIIIEPENLEAEVYELKDDKYYLKGKFQKEGFCEIDLDICKFEMDFSEIFDL